MGSDDAARGMKMKHPVKKAGLLLLGLCVCWMVWPSRHPVKKALIPRPPPSAEPAGAQAEWREVQPQPRQTDQAARRAQEASARQVRLTKAAASKAKQQQAAAARKAEQRAAAAAARKAKQEKEAAAARKAKQEKEAAAATRKAKQKAAAAAARKAKQEKEAAAAARKAKQEKEAAAAARKAKQEKAAAAAARKAKQEKAAAAATRKAKQEKEAAAAARKAKQAVGYVVGKDGVIVSTKEAAAATRKAKQEKEAPAAARKAKQEKEASAATRKAKQEEPVKAVQKEASAVTEPPPTKAAALLIAINTVCAAPGYTQQVQVPRSSGKEYVVRVADGLAEQLKALDQPGQAELRVLMPRERDETGVLNRVRATLKSKLPAGGWSVGSFAPDLADPKRPAKFREVPDLTPGPSARQQTRDVASMLRALAPSCSEAVLLMEDDFMPCPGMLARTRHAIQQAATMEATWTGVRVSYGMNGIVLRCADLRPMAKYLVEEQLNMPVDLLTDEWHMKSTPKTKKALGDRRHFFYRFNLLEHIGTVSTFKGRGERKGLACGKTLVLVNSFVPGTSFNEKACRQADIYPCSPSIYPSSQTSYPHNPSQEMLFQS